jgi:hypothetical protein
MPTVAVGRLRLAVPRLLACARTFTPLPEADCAVGAAGPYLGSR